MTMRTGFLALMLAVFSCTLVHPARAEAPPADRAEVLVLGVYHMANPGRDVFNIAADDVLSPRRPNNADVRLRKLAELVSEADLKQ